MLETEQDDFAEMLQRAKLMGSSLVKERYELQRILVELSAKIRPIAPTARALLTCRA